MDEYHISMPDSSIHYSKKIQLFSKNNDPVLYAKAIRGEARCLITIGQFKRATELLSSARNTFEKHHLSHEISKTDHFFAILFYQLKAYEKSIYHFKKVLDFAQQHKDSVLAFKAASNLILIHCLVKDTLKAEKYIRIQEKIPLPSESDIFYKFNNLYRYYSLIGEQEKAYHYSVKSFEIANQYGMNDAQISSLINQGRALKALGKFADSRHKLLKALSLAKTDQNLTEQSTIIALLMEDAARRKDYKQSYIYSSELNQINDSLNIMEANYLLRNSENSIQLSEKEKLIARQKNDLLHSQLEAQKSQQQLVVFGSLAAIISLISLMVFMGYFQIRKSNKLIAHQKKETESQKERLASLHELNQQIFAIISHDFKAPLTSLQVLLSMIQKQGAGSSVNPALVNDVKVQLAQAGLVLDNLIQFAKSELQRDNPIVKKALVVDILERVKSEFKPDLIQKNLQLQIELPPELESAISPSLMLIVCRNLISNAIKYSYNDSIIRVYTLDSGELIFDDSGIGISDEQKEKLFREHMESEQGTGLEVGFGLGLKIASELLMKEGAWIEIVDKPGPGSRFVLNFKA